MMPPLLSSAANALLEAKLRRLIKLDPFWREQLHTLNGLRLKLILTDIGFKRVIQFGCDDLHLAAPFSTADVSLTTRTAHLMKLLNSSQTQQAISEGHFYLQGDLAAFERIGVYLSQLDLDWETHLAEFLPAPLAYQAVSLANIGLQAAQQALAGLQRSHQFYTHNEYHGR